MPSKITFQGKEYNSLEELPPEAKQALEKLSKVFDDKDQNGVPDFLEGKAGFTDMFKNIYNAKGANVLSITNSETKIENSQALNASTPQINTSLPLNTGLPSTNSNGTTLFIIGVIVIAFLLLGGALFVFRSGLLSPH